MSYGLEVKNPGRPNLLLDTSTRLTKVLGYIDVPPPPYLGLAAGEPYRVISAGHVTNEKFSLGTPWWTGVSLRYANYAGYGVFPEIKVEGNTLYWTYYAYQVAYTQDNRSGLRIMYGVC